jgi:hypothetical protein
MAWGRSVRGSGLTAAVLLTAAIVAGCSSNVAEQPPAAAGGSPFRDRMSKLFFGTKAEETQALAANTADPNLDCPMADIRAGASTLRLPPGSEGAGAGSTLRYQATISRLARECQVRGPTMTVKVGVQGRVIIGPAGGPGQIEIPLRYALVQEGPEPKTILTKLYRFPVTIGDGQNSAPFLHIEEDFAFPVPPGGQLESYVVYVGFDPGAAKEQPAKKPRKTR